MGTTFRTRISLSFGLLVLALAALLSFGLAAQQARVALQDRGDALQTLARSTATVLAEGLYERMREVETLATTHARGDQTALDGAAWYPLLERLQASRPQFSWIGVADLRGNVLAATGKLLVGKDVSERPWFRAAGREAHAGDVHDAKLLAALLPPSISGEPVRFLDFAAPIRDRNGIVQGVLGVHATWDWAHEVVMSLVSTHQREAGVDVFILDRQGKLIHKPLDSTVATGPAGLDAVTRGGAAGLAWDDGHFLTAAATMSARSETTDLRWTVVTRQPMTIAQAAANEARRSYLLLGAGAVVFAMLFAWWLAGRFSGPLAAIAGAARRVEAGDWQAEIPATHAIREIAHLSSALRGMKASLLERERALEQANSELEKRVQQRTVELEGAREALEAANRVLSGLAHRDGLTGLYNRRAADERLAVEIDRHRRSGASLSVLLLDIDHFKSINDRLGHAGGDAVLRRVAARLNECCRSSDFIARFGGEEFLILMPETDAAQARVAAEKIRSVLADDPLAPTVVTVSIGVASPAHAYNDAAEVLRAADDALYAAKAAGRNRVVMQGEDTTGQVIA